MSLPASPLNTNMQSLQKNTTTMTDQWKKIGEAPRAFEPKILDKESIKKYCSQNKNRFIIAACDFDYFENKIESLISYERSGCSIPYIVFILSERISEEEILRKKIKKIKQRFNIKKTLVELFSCEGVSKLENKIDRLSYKEYKINYIRCARFVLAYAIWKIMNQDKAEQTLLNASAYIIDYDNYILDDFNAHLKKIYGDKQAVFCWQSEISGRADFPNTLSSLSVNNNKIITSFSLSHKCIKSGFTALSPCTYSRHFLWVFQAYSIGITMDKSFTNHRLFGFYYGDQLSTLIALREIKENPALNYKISTGWIDMSSSILVSLSQKPGVMIWAPKGNNQIPKRAEP